MRATAGHGRYGDEIEVFLPIVGQVGEVIEI